MCGSFSRAAEVIRRFKTEKKYILNVIIISGTPDPRRNAWRLLKRRLCSCPQFPVSTIDRVCRVAQQKTPHKTDLGRLCPAAWFSAPWKQNVQMLCYIFQCRIVLQFSGTLCGVALKYPDICSYRDLCDSLRETHYLFVYYIALTKINKPLKRVCRRDLHSTARNEVNQFEVVWIKKLLRHQPTGS